MEIVLNLLSAWTLPPPFSPHAFSSKRGPCLHLSLSNSPYSPLSVVSSLFFKFFLKFSHILFVALLVWLSPSAQVCHILFHSVNLSDCQFFSGLSWYSGGKMLGGISALCQRRACPTLYCPRTTWNTRDHQQIWFSALSPLPHSFSPSTLLNFSLVLSVTQQCSSSVSSRQDFSMTDYTWEEAFFLLAEILTCALVEFSYVLFFFFLIAVSLWDPV